MNLSSELLAALNTQYARELSNHRLYLRLAAPLDAGNAFLGCATFFRKNATEELDHAQLFYDYINDRNEKVNPPVLGKPAEITAKNLVDLFEEAFVAESANSAALLTLYDMADTPTKIFLQPIILEQVKSERKLTEIIAQMDLADDDLAALFEIDDRLGKA